MSDELAVLILDFVKDTMVGQEGGMYKMFSHSGMCVSGLKENNAKMLLFYGVVDYMNLCYRSLIKKDDEYVVERFSEMKAVLNHSEICLLNIVFATIKNIHDRLDRSQFDTTDYEKYKNSVHQQIINISLSMFDSLKNSLGHDCTGEKIENCNPDEDMFHISLRPQ